MGNSDCAFCTFFIFDTYAAAENAIRTHRRSGFDMKKLSLVGKGNNEVPAVWPSTGIRINGAGSSGPFWGSIEDLLCAPTVFALPALGAVGIAGPFLGTYAETLALDASDEQTAMTIALMQIGIPKAQVSVYEEALRTDKYLLVVHSSAQDQAMACNALFQAMAWPQLGTAPACAAFADTAAQDSISEMTFSGARETQNSVHTTSPSVASDLG